MQVKKNTLLLLACLVWTAAGVNILRIGLLAYATQVSLPHILLSLLVFFLFQVFVFGRLVGKHTRRILGYWEDRQFFLRFFDKKSFLLMAGMMSLGMFLRVSGLAPDPFLAVFYSGLGAALLGVVKGAFALGVHYMSFYSADTDLVRITGYLVKRSEKPVMRTRSVSAE